MLSTINKLAKNLANRLPKNMWLLLSAFVIVMLLLVYYNKVKLPKFVSGMTDARAASPGVVQNMNKERELKGHNETDEEYAKVQGIATNTHGLAPSCDNDMKVDPSELLPKDKNSEWATLNPHGAGELSDVNLIKAGHHIGINTVGNTLRNANLQIRSEPPNPQQNVGPWNQTTIDPDLSRIPLELGSSK
jgi:hypothetical protein|tara:strand:- start:3460 stop:4029 length:570 start_codon:yes stop_codon:yes gene_type:complete